MISDIETWSVRDLVPHPDPELMPDHRNGPVHRAAQSALARKYRSFRAEASVAADFELDDRALRISGRLDGYRITPGGVILYEIKPVPGSAERWRGHPALQPARWQLQLYADLAQNMAAPPWGKRSIAACTLLLVGVDGRIAPEEVEWTSAAGLVRQRLEVLLSAERISQAAFALSADGLHVFGKADADSDRPLQAQATELLRECTAPPRILLSMPPGAGKTRVAVRFALQRGAALGMPVYWITMKARGRESLQSELDRYRAAGIPLRVLWKTSVERLCECGYDREFCPLRQNVRELFFRDGIPLTFRDSDWYPEDVVRFARDRNLCPHELSVALESAADLIIADFNYLLRPSSLRRRRAILVIDESQNVASRIRDFVTVSIERHQLQELLSGLDPALRRRFALLARPSEWTAENVEDIRARLSGLSDCLLASGDHTELSRRIRTASACWTQYAESYVMHWLHDGTRLTLVGTLRSVEPFAAMVYGHAAQTLALSGSLPASGPARECMLPGSKQFLAIEIAPSTPPPVAFVPKLSFRHPLTSEDHKAAVEILLKVRAAFPPTIAVFGQNRESNSILAWQLRQHNRTALLDEDCLDAWPPADDFRPDFLLISIAGRHAESVNPPEGLLSAGIVLAPGHKPPTHSDTLLRSLRKFDAFESDDVADVSEQPRELAALAVSRVIQAAGRLQRSPDSCRPVFLVNEVFAREPYLAMWPDSWFIRPRRESIHSSMKESIESMKHAVHYEG